MQILFTEETGICQIFGQNIGKNYVKKIEMKEHTNLDKKSIVYKVHMAEKRKMILKRTKGARQAYIKIFVVLEYLVDLLST